MVVRIATGNDEGQDEVGDYMCDNSSVPVLIYGKKMGKKNSPRNAASGDQAEWREEDKTHIFWSDTVATVGDKNDNSDD